MSLSEAVAAWFGLPKEVLNCMVIVVVILLVVFFSRLQRGDDRMYHERGGKVIKKTPDGEVLLVKADNTHALRDGPNVCGHHAVVGNHKAGLYAVGQDVGRLKQVIHGDEPLVSASGRFVPDDGRDALRRAVEGGGHEYHEQ